MQMEAAGAQLHLIQSKSLLARAQLRLLRSEVLKGQFCAKNHIFSLALMIIFISNSDQTLLDG